MKRIVHRLQTELMEENGTDELWLSNLAHNLGALIKTGNLSNLLRDTLKDVIRRKLALLMHLLESHSAFAGLLSCKSPTDVSLWLDVFLPEIDGVLPLGNLAITNTGLLGIESLTLQTNCTMSLLWPYSYVFFSSLMSYKETFMEVCAPRGQWNCDIALSMTKRICLQLVTDHPLLRHIAKLCMSCDQVSNDDEQSLSNHAQALESFWINNHADFAEDALNYISESQCCDKVFSIKNLKQICSKLGQLYRSNEDHPTNIVVEYWRTEPLLQTALQLCLLIDEDIESSTDNFFDELITKAGRSCISRFPEMSISTWLSTTKQYVSCSYRLCNNIEVNDCRENPALRRVQMCIDFCTCLHYEQHDVERYLKYLFTQKADSSIEDIINGLALASEDGNIAEIRSTADMDRFAHTCIVRDFELSYAITSNTVSSNAVKKEIAHNAMNFLCKLLRKSECSFDGCNEEDVEPMIGVALRNALFMNNLMTSYQVGKGHVHCFGKLSTVIDESLRKSSKVASLVSFLLFENFVSKIEERLLNPITSPSNLELSFSCTTYSNAVHPRVETLSSNKTISNFTSNLCKNFDGAIACLKKKLNKERPEASSIYHLSFIKAFIYILIQYMLRPSCTSNNGFVQTLVLTLEAALSFDTDNEQPRKVLQEYTLKELCRTMSMDRIMLELDSGNIGKLLPSIKQRCSLCEKLPTASGLGFDPFKTYGESYNVAQKRFQGAFSDEEFFEFSQGELLSILFAVALSAYLPRSITVNERRDRSIDAATKQILGNNQTQLAMLIRATSSNDFSCLNESQTFGVMKVRQGSDRCILFVQSLVIHMAGLISHNCYDDDCPFSKYAKRPDSCTASFILCAPPNEMINAMNAASNSEPGQANTATKCSCGFMYVIGDCGRASSSMTCPTCKRQLGGSNHTLNQGQTSIENSLPDADEPGYIIDTQSSMPFHTIRDMSPLSYRVLHFLVHLSMFCGSLLGCSGLNNLVKVADSDKHCWDVLIQDYSCLVQLLGEIDGDAICAWLHEVVQNLPNFCCTQRKEDISSAEARQEWEGSFDKKFVSPLKAMISECLRSRPFNDDHVPLLIRVVDEDPVIKKADFMFFPDLFTAVKVPNFKALQGLIMRDTNEIQKHPLIAHIVNHIDLLEIMQYLWPFVYWERLARENCASVVERGKAQNMSVGDLFEQVTTEKRSLLQHAFTQFSDAWNGIVKMLREKNAEISKRYFELCDCHPVSPEDIQEMTPCAQLTISFIDPDICSDPAGNLFRLFLHMLSKAQNDFLQMPFNVVSMSGTQQVLNFGEDEILLSSSPFIPVLKFQPHNSVVRNINDVKSHMLKYVLPRTNFATTGFKFDLDAMQLSTAALLLTGSRCIDLDANELANDGRMPKIAPSIFLFKGELLHRHKDLQYDFGVHIKQEPLTNILSFQDDPFLQESKKLQRMS